MIYDNDIDYGDNYSDFEEIQDYSFTRRSEDEHTRELDGSLSWNDTELTWRED